MTSQTCFDSSSFGESDDVDNDLDDIIDNRDIIDDDNDDDGGDNVLGGADGPDNGGGEGKSVEGECLEVGDTGTGMESIRTAVSTTTEYYYLDVGNIDECRMLIEEEGVDVNKIKWKIMRKRGYYELGCLPFACFSSESLDVIEFLVSKGADINERDYMIHGDYYYSCLDFCCGSRGRLDVVQFLVSKGADFRKKKNSSHSCFMKACWNGRLDIADFLISSGADIHEVGSPNNTTCFMMACDDNRLDTAAFLLSKGANIHDKNVYGDNSLMNACKEGKIDTAEFLLSKGVCIYEGSHQRSCFSCALGYYHIRVLYRLRKWPTTMAIILLQELALIYIIDSESLIDLHQFLGRPDDCSKTDIEEDYEKDKDGNVPLLSLHYYMKITYEVIY